VDKPAVKGSYERAYHDEVHGRLGDTPRYYDLKARQAVGDYFADVDPRGDVFEFGLGLGKNVARLPHASGFDVSEYARSFSASKGVRVYASMDESRAVRSTRSYARTSSSTSSNRSRRSSSWGPFFVRTGASSSSYPPRSTRPQP